MNETLPFPEPDILPFADGKKDDISGKQNSPPPPNDQFVIKGVFLAASQDTVDQNGAECTAPPVVPTFMEILEARRQARERQVENLLHAKRLKEKIPTLKREF